MCISTHAPRTGSDAYYSYNFMERWYFNPRSPHGERRERMEAWFANVGISTHAPRTGSDFSWGCTSNCMGYFNPRSPHGERHKFKSPNANYHIISTHAPRTGSDPLGYGEGVNQLFQPTLPARGATPIPAYIEDAVPEISTHAPRTGSDEARIAYQNGIRISTHAPRTGSDAMHGKTAEEVAISTHAPRTGSDRNTLHTILTQGHFNPRSPHGERHHDTAFEKIRSDFNPRSPHGERRAWRQEWAYFRRFQPTLPARGATNVCFSLSISRTLISTHAPRTGSDHAEYRG